MKVQKTQRMHIPAAKKRTWKLFNLTGPNPSAKQRSLKEKAKAYKKQQEQEKVAFDPANTLTFGAPVLSGSNDNLSLWSDFYRTGKGRNFDGQRQVDRAMAIRDYVDRGGPKTDASGLSSKWQQVAAPAAVHSAAGLQAGYNQATQGLAKLYTDQGMDPETAMMRARATMGSRGDFRQSVMDDLYQHGSAFQQMFVPGEEMLDARARAIVGGAEGGGSIYSGVVGGLGDYFTGNQRLQEEAQRQARLTQGNLRKETQKALDNPVQRSARGFSVNNDALRQDSFNRIYGKNSITGGPADKYDMEGLTQDFRRGRGITGFIPGLGSRRSEGTVRDEDLRHARHGSWGDLSKVTRFGGGLANWMQGSDWESGAHERMMEASPAYASRVKRLNSGGYQAGDDVSGIIQGDKGEEASWYNPWGWVGDGRVGDTSGVDFTQALGNNNDFRGEKALASMGYLSGAHMDKLRQNWGAIHGNQREALGIDKAFDRGSQAGVRQRAAAHLNVADMARRSRARNAAPTAPTGSTGAIGGGGAAARASQDADGSTAGKQVTAADATGISTTGDQRSPWPSFRPAPNLATHTGTSYDGSQSQRNMTGLQAHQQQWRRNQPLLQKARNYWQSNDPTNTNPLRPNAQTNPYMPGYRQRSWSDRFTGAVATDADVRRADDNIVGGRHAIETGGWQPGMRAEDMVETGWGWTRPLGGVGDFLGITSSKRQQVGDLYKHQLKSKGMEDLEDSYASGFISPKQFQEYAGGNLSDIYGADPEGLDRLHSLMQKARKARAGLAADALAQKAVGERQRILGDHWDSSFLT